MPAIPGTSDGYKIADKREYHLSDSIKKYYKKMGEWDKITDCGTYGDGTTISVRLGKYRKDTWRLIKRNPGEMAKWTKMNC